MGARPASRRLRGADRAGPSVSPGVREVVRRPPGALGAAGAGAARRGGRARPGVRLRPACAGSPTWPSARRCRRSTSWSARAPAARVGGGGQLPAPPTRSRTTRSATRPTPRRARLGGASSTAGRSRRCARRTARPAGPPRAGGRPARGGARPQPAAAGDEAMRLLAARDAIAHYDRGAGRSPSGRTVDAPDRRPARVGAAGLRERRAVGGRAARARGSPRRPGRRRDASSGRSCSICSPRPCCLAAGRAQRASRRRRGSGAGRAGRAGRRGDGRPAAGWPAPQGADGRRRGGHRASTSRRFARAGELGTAPPGPVLTLHSLSLYWLGRFDEAVERSRAGRRAAPRRTNDASVMMYSLPHLGLALAAQRPLRRGPRGLRRGAAVRAPVRRPHPARARDRHVGRFPARLWDFARHEALSSEAREFALSVELRATGRRARASTCCSTSRGAVRSAAPRRLMAEVAAAVEKASGFTAGCGASGSPRRGRRSRSRAATGKTR